MLRNVWMPVLVPGGAAAAVLALIVGQGPAGHVGLFVTGVAAAGIVFSAVDLLMPAAGSERRVLKDARVAASRAFRRLSGLRATQ